MHFIYQIGDHHCPFSKQRESKSLGTALVAQTQRERERLQRAEIIHYYRRHSPCSHLDNLASSAPVRRESSVSELLQADPKAACVLKKRLFLAYFYAFIN